MVGFSNGGEGGCHSWIVQTRALPCNFLGHRVWVHTGAVVIQAKCRVAAGDRAKESHRGVQGNVGCYAQHSTDILEATAVVEACRAVVTALQEHQVTVDVVLAFCDNQGAATSLALRKLTHKGESLMDRVVCDFHDLAEQIPLVMGWCPAQHDAKLQGVLAKLNKRADKATKQARHTHNGLSTMPVAWVDGHAFACNCKGRRVMGIKQAIRETLLEAGEIAPSEQGHVRMQHVSQGDKDVVLRKLWTQCAFRHPCEQAGALSAAFCENTRDMYIGTEGQGECPACHQSYECRIEHAHLQCPSLW